MPAKPPPAFITENFQDIKIFHVKSHKQNENDKSLFDSLSNRFEFLPRIFINLGWTILLIPFRLKEVRLTNSKWFYEPVQNLTQKIICMIFCATASIVCFVVAYGKIGGKNIENNPMVIFNFWSYSVFCGWCFLFTNLMFRKQRQILSLINKQMKNQLFDGDIATTLAIWSTDKKKKSEGKCGVRNVEKVQVEVDYQQDGKNGKFRWTWDEFAAGFYFYMVVAEEFYHKTVFYLFPVKYDWKMAAEYYSGFAMQSLFVRAESTSIPYEEIDSVMLAVSVWHFIGWQIFGAIKSLVYIYVTFYALFLIGKFEIAMKKLKELEDSELIWELFIEIRSTVDAINELVALPILGIYLILVPFLSSAFIQRWDSDYIEYKILMVLQFVWPMIALVLASEATRKGEKFLSRVKDKTESLKDPSDDKMTTAYFVFENANLGLRGGKFFTLSYGFLGTTLSVIMTYALVILGFLFENDSSKKTCCPAKVTG